MAKMAQNLVFGTFLKTVPTFFSYNFTKSVELSTLAKLPKWPKMKFLAIFSKTVSTIFLKKITKSVEFCILANWPK